MAPVSARSPSHTVMLRGQASSPQVTALLAFTSPAALLWFHGKFPETAKYSGEDGSKGQEMGLRVKGGQQVTSAVGTSPAGRPEASTQGGQHKAAALAVMARGPLSAGLRLQAAGRNALLLLSGRWAHRGLICALMRAAHGADGLGVLPRGE